MKFKKLFTLLGVSFCALSLAGCTSSLGGHTVKIRETSNKNPVIISTYNQQEQKVDQFKTASVKIKADSKVTNAVDINYGENRIVHSASPLIAYQGLTNYVDKYNSAIAQKQLTEAANLHDVLASKNLPTSGDIYNMYKRNWPTNGTVVEVKTQSGSLIGCFVGAKVSLTDFGDVDSANAVINLDDHKIFVYNASYTLYPISAMKSMAENSKATSKSLQANVTTHDGLAVTK